MARLINLSSDKLTAANAPAQQPGSGSFAVSVWARRTRTTATELVLSGGNTAVNDAGWKVYLTASGGVNARVSDGTSNARTTATVFTDTANWHHLLLVIDRDAGLLRMYFDGSATGFAGNPSDSLSGFGPIAQADAMLAGQNSAGGETFVGTIGPVAILKGRIPTTQEIADLAAGKPAHQVWAGANLSASYPLCGADLSEYSNPSADNPMVATNTTYGDGPAQTWAVGSLVAYDSDTFAGTDGTDLAAHASTGLGHAWAYHPTSSTGTLEIRSGKISRPVGSTSGPMAYLQGTPSGQGTGLIRFNGLALSATPATQQPTLMVRLATGDATYLGFQLNPGTGWRSVVSVAGTAATVDGKAHTPAVETMDLVVDVEGTRYFLFQGTNLLASVRSEDATLKAQPLTPGFRVTGSTAEPNPAAWSLDGLSVEYPTGATTFTLTGPTTGLVNAASSNFTVTPDGPFTGTITITPSGGGLSTPIVKTFSGSATPQTFTITPTSAGAVTLTPTNSGSLTNPSNLTYTASVPTATAFSLAGPTTGVVNVASTDFTITPNASYTGTITITPSGGGLSTPIVKTFSGSATPQTFTITPTATGTVTLTPTNNGSLTNPANKTYAVTATAPETVTLDQASVDAIVAAIFSQAGTTPIASVLKGIIDTSADASTGGAAAAANLKADLLAAEVTVDEIASAIFTQAGTTPMPSILKGIGDASTDATTGGATAMDNLKADMLAAPVTVDEIADASAALIGTKSDIATATSLVVGTKDAIAAAAALLIGTLQLNIGTVLANPAPTTTSFSATLVDADGNPVTGGDGGFKGMNVIFQGSQDYKRTVASHEVVGSTHKFTIAETNPLPAGFPTAGITFKLG